MTISKIEHKYYTKRKARAEGFIKRITKRAEDACQPHYRDIDECEAKLREMVENPKIVDLTPPLLAVMLEKTGT